MATPKSSADARAHSATDSPFASLIDQIVSEGAIGMSEASALCGHFRAGKPTHPSTLTRWCIDGISKPTCRLNGPAGGWSIATSTR